MAGTGIKFGTGTVADFVELVRCPNETGIVDGATAAALYARLTGVQAPASIFDVSRKVREEATGRVYMSTNPGIGSYVPATGRSTKAVSVETTNANSTIVAADKAETARQKAMQAKAETLFTYALDPVTGKRIFATIEQARAHVERIAHVESVEQAAAAVAKAEQALKDARQALKQAQARLAAFNPAAAAATAAAASNPAAAASKDGAAAAAAANPEAQQAKAQQERKTRTRKASAPAGTAEHEAQQAAAAAANKARRERGPSTASMSEALTRAAAAAVAS